MNAIASALNGEPIAALQNGRFPAHRPGRAEMVFETAPGGKTYLSSQCVAYPFHVTRLFYMDDEWPELATLYLASASGGLFQGDRLSINAEVKRGAAVHLTTGSATKVHGMENGFAVHGVDLTVGKDGYLEYMNEPTILFPGSSLHSRLNISLESGGCAILGDAFLMRRTAESDGPSFDEFFNEVSVYGKGETLLALDRMHIPGLGDAISAPGLTGDRFVMGSIYFLTLDMPPGRLASCMRDAAVPFENVYAAASTLPGGCGAFMRALSSDDAALNAALRHVAAICRETATGKAMGPRRK